jgi:hypothetical protein
MATVAKQSSINCVGGQRIENNKKALKQENGGKLLYVRYQALN